jgi:uncharacterized RDD family membrane protein YckC
MDPDIASPARRLGGYLLDALYGAIASILISLFVPTSGEASLQAVWLMLGYIIIGIYFWTKGTSPGKVSLGMYVVKRQSSQRVGFLTMLIRETIGKAISGLILSLGYLWILLDNNKQGWHDKLVDTVVIKQ